MLFNKPKMSLRPAWALLFASLALLSVSCGNIKIRNGEWCGDMGPEGASCFNTLNSETRDIPNDTWRKLEVGPDHLFGKVCTDSENFAHWSASIQKLCRAYKKCTFDVKRKVAIFKTRVETFEIKLANTFPHGVAEIPVTSTCEQTTMLNETAPVP